MLTAINNKQHGFSLIELAVVLVIMGFILSSVVGSLSVSLEGSKVKATNERLQQVRKSLLNFYDAYQRFPCPATLTSSGSEKFKTAAEEKCQSWKGYVPLAQLGVKGKTDSKNRLLDAWGSPIIYTISEEDNEDGSLSTPTTNTSDGKWDFIVENQLKKKRESALSAPKEPEPKRLQINTMASDCTTNTGQQNNVIVLLSSGKNAKSGSFTSNENENAKQFVFTVNDFSGIENRVFFSTPIVSAESKCGHFDDLVESITFSDAFEKVNQ